MYDTMPGLKLIVTLGLYFLILPLFSITSAQSFTKIEVNFLEVWNSHAAWGDYDNDGDFDILVTGENASGQGTSRIIRNDNNTFVETNIEIKGLYDGSVVWGDYDNDNDLDFLITGRDESAEHISLIYTNTGQGFVESGVSLSGAHHGAWGDYDNDGDLDLLLVGSNSLRDFSKVYRNDNGQFSNIGAPLRGILSGEGRWGDIDNDGDLDVLISGQESEGFSPRFSMYLNNDGDFTYSPLSASLNDNNSNATFGDFDNDGDLDLLRAQYTGSNSSSVSSDILSIVDPNLPGSPGIGQVLYFAANIPISEAIWGDLDNDGDMDAVIPNPSSNSYRLYTYGGGQLFDTGYDLDTLSGHEIILADYDNDNDIDFLVTGNGKACVHRNNISSKNDIPNPPAETSQLLSNNREQVLLSWGPGNDEETSTAGLAYNVRVGTSSQSNDVATSMALANGQRTIIDPNTIIHSRNWTVTNLEPSTYYWSVQTLDNTQGSSAFSEEGVFSTLFSRNDHIVGTLDQFGSVEWGDYDNDNDLDILVTNDQSGSSTKTSIYRNDSGEFVDINANLLGASSGATWADYDNDGDLDVLIYGLENAIGSFDTKLYQNDFGRYFETDIVFPSNFWLSAQWGDYDNDSDLDILFTEFGETGTTSVYQNEANQFTDLELSLPGPSTNRSRAEWGDFDADGDLDILLVHCDIQDAFNKSSSCILVNEDGTFADMKSFLVNPFSGEAAWGDYDNDGDLDVYVNDNGLCVLPNVEGELEESECFSPGSTEASSFNKPVIGDYDGDGDLDFYSASAGIQRNNTDSFLGINAGLSSELYHAATWGDYDNDGDLDILTAGLNARLHRNDGTFASAQSLFNARPGAPINLSVEEGESSAMFSWEPGQDEDTPTEGLSYNIYIGTRPGGHNILSPLALENGVRLVQAPGNAGQNTRWEISGLIPGRTYYWGVQTIDSAYEGSEFIEGPSFVPEGLAPPVELAAISNESGIQIAWKEIADISEVSNYNLLRRIQTSTFVSTSFDSTASTAPGSRGFVDEDVELGSGYAYRIIAEDLSGSKTSTSEEVFTYKVPFDESLIPFDTTLQSTALFELDLDDYFTDLPDGELTYSTLTIPYEVASSRIVRGGKNSLIVVPKNIGTARVLVQVHNEEGEGAATGLNISINAVPSIAQTLPTQYVTVDAAPFTIDLTTLFQSQDGSPLTYSFSTSNAVIANLVQQQDSLLLVSVTSNAAVGASTTIDVTATNTLGGAASLSFDLVIDAMPSISTPSLPAQGSISEETPFSLVAEIDDNSGVESASIHFRLGGEQQFFSAEMTGSPSAPNTFEYTFPQAVINKQGLEYFITAQDVFGLESRYPESNIVSIPVSLPNGVTRNSIQPFGNSQTAYRLVSFPIDVDQDKRNALRAMENVLGDYNVSQWRFFALTNEQTFIELHEARDLEIEPGRAYLMIVRENRPALSTPAGRTLRTDQLFQMTLHPGWNLIGNPFNFDVPMNNLRLESGRVVDLRTYQSDAENEQSPRWRTVSAQESIVPFEGYAIFNEASEDDILIIEPNLTQETITSTASKASTGQDSLLWSIQILASSQEALDTDNWVAVSNTAQEGKDSFDRAEPPSVGEFVSVYFSRPEWESTINRFQSDIRPEFEDGGVWEFEVATNINDVVDLQFAGLERVPEAYEIWLVDELLNVTHNLREQASYALSLRDSRTLKLVVGNSEYAHGVLEANQDLPTEYALHQNFPNPFNGSTTIAYSLPEEAPVTIEVFNILGQRVANLVSGEIKPAGQHAIAWDASHAANGALTSGAYLVRIQAGSFTQTMKMLIVR